VIAGSDQPRSEADSTTGSESGDNSLSASIVRALAELWSAPVSIRGLRAFGDGHSGFTYLADLEGAGWSGEYVVRLSPPGARIAGPADVGRQGRLMAGLGRHGLPVPPIIAADSSGLADGRALVVMQRVDGTGWEAAASELGDRAVAELAVGFLKRLGEVDPRDLAISEPPVSLAAELDRWHGLLRYCPDWLAVPCDRLYRALAADLPCPGPERLVHGDFHYGNMLFHSGSVAGVLDWEIATVSDQRLDVGCLAVASLRRRYPEPNPTGGLDVSLGELAQMSGVPVDEARWFAAAGCLKYAAILGYNLGLHRKGRRVDALYEQLVLTMRGLATDGITLLQGDDLSAPA
jgi:aminoglycoside phosphotransferase (APT) family kinase protein